MKRIHTFLLVSITAAVFLAMAFLKASVKQMNDAGNGFKRKQAPFSITKIAERRFYVPLRDVAGVSGDSIFIVTARPNEIILTNSALTKEQMIDLPITAHNKLAGNFTVRLNYPDLYIFGSNVPCVIRYDLIVEKETIYPVSRAFSRNALIDTNTVIIRGFDSSFKDENISTINLLTGARTVEKDLTDRTDGGGFVTDGMLHFDKKTNTIVYHHFYSNKILYADTGLQLLHKGTGIDTFNTYTAKAVATSTAKGTYFSFTAPPKLLSNGSCVSEGRLYIHSRLKADNETSRRFMNSIVIDVYDINTRSYTGTLYVPSLPGKRLVKFNVLHDRFYAIYENQLVVYSIR
ncbi:hypothetical protein [Longitalea luteola]|uniref:hypothetical protein n=1 Tax=Longitalea luteola TaxID=2812563 RepID=UPI001A97550A|nr:hypothetical protein [Longitalea luteola]